VARESELIRRLRPDRDARVDAAIERIAADFRDFAGTTPGAFHFSNP